MRFAHSDPGDRQYRHDRRGAVLDERTRMTKPEQAVTRNEA